MALTHLISGDRAKLSEMKRKRDEAVCSFCSDKEVMWRGRGRETNIKGNNKSSEQVSRIVEHPTVVRSKHKLHKVGRTLGTKSSRRRRCGSHTNWQTRSVASGQTNG